MKLNRAELKKIIYDFNSISNRLINADFQDYLGIMKKYVVFVKTTPIIYDYVVDCGPCEQDMEQEFEKRDDYYPDVFDLGETDEEEVRNVFAIMNYIAENNILVHGYIGWAYTPSKKYQDMVKAFNDRVVMVFVHHIEAYLTKIGIDMGLDDKVNYNISISGGQVNIANDNAVINATNNDGVDYGQLMELIAKVRENASNISDEDTESMNDSLEVIEDLTKSEKPKRGLLKTAITALKAIKGSAEFAAAVATLVAFVQSLP